MRYAVLMGALAFTLCAGVCEAEDGRTEDPAAEEAGSPTGLKHIDLGDEPEGNPEEPVTQVGVMSPGESYDENTGLPDVVESDSDMEIR